jgi:hypothetical protein
MSRPRMSVSMLMIVTAIISFFIAAVRWAEAWRSYCGDTSGIPAMAGTHIILLAVMARRLARSGESGGYFFGFEVFGWLAVSAYMACLLFAPGLFSSYGEWVITPLWHAIGPSHAQESIEAVDRVSMTLFGMTNLIAYTAPQLLIASFGGWLFRRLGIKVVVGARSFAE